MRIAYIFQFIEHYDLSFFQLTYILYFLSIITLPRYPVDLACNIL